MKKMYLNNMVEILVNKKGELMPAIGDTFVGMYDCNTTTFLKCKPVSLIPNNCLKKFVGDGTPINFLPQPSMIVCKLSGLSEIE